MLLWHKQCVGWITALHSAEPVTFPSAVGIIWGRTKYSKDGPALQWGITNEQANEERHKQKSHANLIHCLAELLNISVILTQPPKMKTLEK